MGFFGAGVRVRRSYLLEGVGFQYGGFYRINSQDPTYQHPFPHTLLPPLLAVLDCHIQRLRSLTVLTDTYAPMHVILRHLSSLKPTVLPHLRSLHLARCNEYIPYNSSFSPQSLFVPLDYAYVPFKGCSMPHLESLILSGVHTNWDALRDLIPKPGLVNLELSYHCQSVRPTTAALRKLLRACPRLRRLAIRLSGISDPGALMSESRIEPIDFPHLETLTLSYSTDFALRSLLRVLCPRASRLKHLAIENASHPADPEQYDVSQTLAYCAQPVDAPQSSGSPTALFPHMTRLSLLRVKATSQSYTSILCAHPKLLEIETSGGGIAPAVVEALCSPLPPFKQGTCAFPCPSLADFRARKCPAAEVDSILALDISRIRGKALNLDLQVEGVEEGMDSRSEESDDDEHSIEGVCIEGHDMDITVPHLLKSLHSTSYFARMRPAPNGELVINRS
jgi:hypothetical protein